MPKPRKPTKILQFTGAFDKNPKRAESRAHEPASTGPIGAPPAELTGHDLTAWLRIVDECPKGVLTKRDRQHVFATALIGGAILGGSRDPKLIAQYRISLAELGMTPASASKVSAPDADEGKANSVAAI